MQKIEPFQIKKIYAIGNALGMVQTGNTEDELHLLIGSITGKDSVKELSYEEADMIIMRLRQLQGSNAPPKKKSTKKHESVPGGITEGQQKKIWALMYALESLDVEQSRAKLGDRLCGIIKKELQIESKAKKPFVWVDYKAGNKLIEVLKKYVSHAKKNGGDVDGVEDRRTK